VLTYTILNDIVYFPDTQETFVPVVVKEENGEVIRTELWTSDKVEALVGPESRNASNWIT